MLLGEALQILADTPAEEPLRVALVFQKNTDYVQEVLNEMRVFKGASLYTSFYRVSEDISANFIDDTYTYTFDIVIFLEQIDDLDYFRRRFQKYFKRHEYELMTEIH